MIGWWIALGLGWAIFAFQLASLALFWVTGRRHLAGLAAAQPEPAAWPRLSVVVPARDEGATIEQNLRSLLASDYPALEVVAVDDRSRDHTGEVMDRLAAADPRLTAVHVRELPEGWLGKCHAMHLGAQAARGELVLFTDGDVIFAPDALRLAVKVMQGHGLDHLVLFPDMIPGGYWENAMTSYFALAFTLLTLPPLVRTRFRFAYVGVGAFNLVRAAAYRAAGGHEPIRLDVADDLKLGKLMKRATGRQDGLVAAGALRVRWQVGLGGVIRGLEKNAFAGFGYSIPALVANTVLVALLSLFPYAAAFLYWGDSRAWGYLASVLAGHLALATGGARFGVGARVGLALPVVVLAFLVAVWRSAVLTLARGGIRWRDTFYPLALLRAHVYR